MMRIAFSTDDGKNLIKDHFGEGKKFLVFEVSEYGVKFLEERANLSEEEKFHGDPSKAKKISEILKDVDVLVGFAMGPNIKRMRQKFLPVISRYESIEENLQIIKERIDEFEKFLVESPKPIVIINKGPKLVKVE